MFGTKDIGQQWVASLIANNTVYIGLYDDTTDNPGDSADLPLESEPNDGNYARLEYSPGAISLQIQQNVEGEWEVFLPEQIFDLVNVTGGTANGVFGVISYQAQGESQANDHLWFTDELTDVNDDPVQVDLIESRSFTYSGTYAVVDLE